MLFATVFRCYSVVFFFSSRRRHTRLVSDWSSDVCSSDLLSIVLAYGIGGMLAAAGVVVSFLYTGSAMATTAIGTLIPILRDNGELKTRFGTRSEERRVGKEGRTRGVGGHLKKKDAGGCG